MNDFELQVIIAVAELCWDQIKAKRKSAGNLAKVQQPFSTKSIDDLFAFLDGSLAEENNSFVCVVIHNIDGPGLRDSDTQQSLARLAACSRIRMVASIDHVNASLCEEPYLFFSLYILNIRILASHILPLLLIFLGWQYGIKRWSTHNSIGAAIMSQPLHRIRLKQCSIL